MRNQINLSGWSAVQINIVNLDALLFHQQQEKQLKPKIKFSENISEKVVDAVKDYLSQDEHRQLIRNSFGNVTKKTLLRDVIYAHVSQKEFTERFAKELHEYTLDTITDYLVEKIAGLDVIQPLAESGTITDIKIIDWNDIHIDDIFKGKSKTNVRFASRQAYEDLCHRFAFASGKTLSASRPSVDATFPFMRVNIVGEDLSPRISTELRIVSKELRLSEQYMLETGYATQEMIDLLKLTFKSHSHLVTGETGSGKTELLRYFTRYLEDNSWIIMIEDTPESYLDELGYDHLAINMWRNRESTDDSKKNFDYEFHLRNAMRQNPDAIFIQESRGRESEQILEAAETGHIVNTTLHASSAVHAVKRFISLCQKAQYYPDKSYYGERITDSFKIGIHVKRYNGVRKISQIVEYVSFEKGKLQANVLFQYNSAAKKHDFINPLSEETWESLQSMDIDLSPINFLEPKVQRIAEVGGIR